MADVVIRIGVRNNGSGRSKASWKSLQIGSIRNNEVSVRHIELLEGVALQALCDPVMRNEDLHDLLRQRHLGKQPPTLVSDVNVLCTSG